MSKFLDRLEQISVSAPAPMGFGMRRSERAPGMALVALVSSDHAAGCQVVASVSPEAALLSGVEDVQALKNLENGLPAIPWGIRSDALTEEGAQAYQEAGSDLVAFTLQKTAVSALSSDDMARILCLDSSIDERQLRAIEPLPVDVILISVPDPTGSWTLGDLTAITAISSRVGKYILVEVSRPPEKKELEALRNAGVHGLVLDVSAVSSEGLADLKTALQDMPRPQPGRRDRSTALLPASTFPRGQTPSEVEEDDDDE